MKISRESIEDTVKNGLVQDIYKMEQAYELLKAIEEKFTESHNRKLASFNKLFKTFYSALQTEALLAASRIYDTPNNKYPTRCLKGILDYLISNSEDLPSIKEPYQLELHLKQMNAPAELIEIISKESNLFAEKFSQFIKSLLDDPIRKFALEKLKLIRDKEIAHNESIETVAGPTWSSLKDLIDISKNVVGVLGWAYFSTAYMINGEYILSKDALSSKWELNNLITLILK